jgi:2-phospho-L-lactate guanylyltransferase
MRTAAVLPIKSFARAKQRLGDAVGAPGRDELAEAMAGDVLEALTAVRGLDELVVVTAEPRAARAAEEVGAVVVPDPEERGQSAAARYGVAAAVERGADRVLLVPGDCPALEPAEVDEILEGGGPAAAGGSPAPAGGSRATVTIVADRHGTGTNALLIAPPQALDPSFGPGSLARHAARARAAGATVHIAVAPSLALDVDTAADLAALRDRGRRARRTRELLERLSVTA